MALLVTSGPPCGKTVVDRGHPLYKAGEPFDDRDGQILKTFADQAAIATSNAKLFNDLDAALARQTAIPG